MDELLRSVMAARHGPGSAGQDASSSGGGININLGQPKGKKGAGGGGMPDLSAILGEVRGMRGRSCGLQCRPCTYRY